MGIHWQELVIVLVIVLVLFGPKRLPEIGSSLGRGIRGFRDSMNGNDAPQPPRAIGAPQAHESVAPAPAPVPVEVVEAPPVDSPAR